jgi:hypothetical protein
MFPNTVPAWTSRKAKALLLIRIPSCRLPVSEEIRKFLFPNSTYFLSPVPGAMAIKVQ